jgi:hypothetical protein
MMAGSCLEMSITVVPADSHHMSHISNAVHLGWVQKSVIDFWHAKARFELVTSRLWVARNHPIKYWKLTSANSKGIGAALFLILDLMLFEIIRRLLKMAIVRALMAISTCEAKLSSPLMSFTRFQLTRYKSLGGSNHARMP